MIELIIKPSSAWKHPWVLCALAFFSVFVAVMLSWNMFPQSSSILIIALCIIPALPIMVKLIEREEVDLEKKQWNTNIIKVYGWYFAGLIIAFCLASLLIPNGVEDRMFFEQRQAIYDFRGPTGFATYFADFNNDGVQETIIYQDGEPIQVVENGKATPYKLYIFRHILFNNLQVMLLIILTSFIFGAGALFILTWNASIVGVFLADMFRGGQVAQGLSIFVHGVPEFLGFFIAAIAGGVISVSMVKHTFADPELKEVLKDAGIYMIAAIVFIFIGAFLEVAI